MAKLSAGAFLPQNTVSPMYRLALALTVSTALGAATASPAAAQMALLRKGAQAEAAPASEIPRCSQNFGAVAIAETQTVLFGQMGMGAPTDLLRMVIRESGCFTLIERGPAMDMVERERSRAGAGQMRPVDFVIVAELANPIDETSEERRSGLLGSLAAVGGRALLSAGIAAAVGGDMDLAGLGQASGLSRQALGAAMNVAGGALGGQGGQPAPALSTGTAERIRDLKKDIGRGKEDAQVEFSLTSVPLAEAVGHARAVANKDELRRLRIRDNQFNGRVGAGYESEDQGKVIALALVRGYADLVTSLGGMDAQTPEITLANRAAVRAAEAEREADAARQSAAERQEQERLNREREAERERIRDEVRREEEARRRAEERPSPTSLTLNRPSILRAAPDGAVVRPLAAQDVVYPTGKVQDDWVEVLDGDDNIGWMQRDRFSTSF